MIKYFIIVLSIIATIALYGLVGAPKSAWQIYQYRQEEARMLPVISALATQQKWAELGSIEWKLFHFHAAAEAYRHAVLQTGGDPAMILQYNKALIFADGGKVSNHAKEGLNMVLKLDPKNLEARYFLAIRKLQDGETESAMKEMKAIYHGLPDDSPLKKLMPLQINK